jgi:hypothetical protein
MNTSEPAISILAHWPIASPIDRNLRKNIQPFQA